MSAPIVTFEHSTLRLKQGLTELQLKDLQAFHGDGTKAFSLVHRGIRTSSYVGVIQVGTTILEILPKTDRDTDENRWRARLIGMLRVVHRLPLDALTESRLALRPGAILELYFELLIRELEGLLRRGLIKRYSRVSSNATALRGRLQLVRHLRENVIHKERFRVEHDRYDRQHRVHAILYAALQLAMARNRSPQLSGRLSALGLHFPTQDPINITPAIFEALPIDLDAAVPRGIGARKLGPYVRALQIARLLLLNDRPDIRGGRHRVLALVFDMNALWEGFVAAALRRELVPEGFTVETRRSEVFWQQPHGSSAKLLPDIVLRHDTHGNVVLDAKWKHLGDNPKPAITDLRQLYVYSHYFNCPSAMLVYPGSFGHVNGTFDKNGLNADKRKGSLLSIFVGEGSISAWMEQVAGAVRGAMR